MSAKVLTNQLPWVKSANLFPHSIEKEGRSGGPCGDANNLADDIAFQTKNSVI